MSSQVDPTSGFDFKKAFNRAMGGGVAGGCAMVVQVCTLMPMRTTMNYQYRYGTSTTEAFRALFKDGGARRFYRGIAPALIQGPLSRFGDTAANQGMLTLLNSNESTKSLPAAVKTVAASFTSAMWRVVLMPVDTLKTTLQTGGANALPLLRAKVATHGIGTLWYGAGATVAATFVGHYPWFAVYNTLNEKIPQQNQMAKKLLRSAGIGFTASVVSDTISNSLRVIKTYRQTHTEKVSYQQAVKEIVDKDGVIGLFGRGLRTRIMTNALQGIMFSVMWRVFEDMFHNKGKSATT